MENERHEHKMSLKQAETEIYEVNRTVATVTANFEKMQKDLIAGRNENKVVSRQVGVLLEEKATLALEMQEKLERERQRADTEARAQLD